MVIFYDALSRRDGDALSKDRVLLYEWDRLVNDFGIEIYDLYRYRASKVQKDFIKIEKDL